MMCNTCVVTMTEDEYKAHIPCDGIPVHRSTLGPGRKDDQGKLRWDLLPFRAVEQIVAVQTFGAKKYGDNNWQKVLSPKGRYFSAAMRHACEWRLGNKTDKESGLPTLAHIGCCILFLLSMHVGFDPILDSDEPV